MKIKSEIEVIQKKYKDAPTLVVVLVGENAASLSYVRGKERACLKAGINCLIYKYDKSVSEKELQRVLQKLNKDSSVNGIIVQLPLPENINEDTIIQSIIPHKDVDGLTTENLGLLAAGTPRFVPATPLGVQKMLSEIIEAIPQVIAHGLSLADEDVGYTAFGQGIASALHETQYTRLFRS